MFVYILSNTSYPGLLKIGFTSRHPSERAKELFTTGVPTPFKVEFAVWCDYAEEAEAGIHKWLDAKRTGERREFFRMSVADAVYEVVVHTTDANVLPPRLAIKPSVWEKFTNQGFERAHVTLLLEQLDDDDLRSLYSRYMMANNVVHPAIRPKDPGHIKVRSRFTFRK